MSGRGFTALIFLSVALCVSALRCWKCENQGLFGCKVWGKVETCHLGDHETCQTEIRYFDRQKVIIRTGCKQGSACSSNNRQNPAGAWAPSQCNKGTKNSVCRCCCTGALCNRRSQNLLCDFPIVRFPEPTTAIPEPRPEKTCGAYPTEPENGQRTCIGGYALRAFCKYTCNDGYQMIGYDMTVCVQRGKNMMWNRNAPLCEKEGMCKPMPNKPQNGRVGCDDDGREGTTCKFSCDSGYELDGPSQTECEKTMTGASWNHETPQCKRIVCDPMPDVPANGEISCSGNGELGTLCYFTCDFGYELLGPTDTTCTKLMSSKAAKWSHDTPTCKKMMCGYIPRDPINGFKECSGRGELGTICSFACDIGYKLDGAPATTCKKIAFRMRWSHRLPICKPMCKTLPEEPENGFKTCNGDGDIGTVCTFDCNPGHEMRGPSATTCQIQSMRADWSHRTPICEPVCKPLPESPEYGRKKCNGDGEVGTTCSFDCNSGYKLHGEPQTTCQKIAGGADWSNEIPTCMAFCEPMPRTPVNGEISCSGGGEIGTLCVFECHPGFKQTGATETICELTANGPNWSDKTPTCTPVCDGLPKAPTNGSVECTGNGELGSVCTFQCNDYGYVLQGNDKSVCVQRGSHPEWSTETPICSIRPVCPALGNMPLGHITCDNPAYVTGTVCRFQCLETRYSLVPLERDNITCDGSGSNLNWTARRPCCVDCAKAKRDIVIAMDSSDSISPTQWKDMKKFVQNLVRKFEVSKEAVQFSIFQFSTAPKSDGLVFGRYSKPQLLRLVGRMRRIGSGTMTGDALEYAQRRLRDRGNRKNIPDMLLVLTDGEAEDTPKLWKESKILRDSGVEILALAIGPTDNFVEQMTRMTGDRSNVLKAARIADLTDELGELLFKKTCQDERECLQYNN